MWEGGVVGGRGGTDQRVGGVQCLGALLENRAVCRRPARELPRLQMSAAFSSQILAHCILNIVRALHLVVRVIYSVHPRLLVMRVA